MVGQGRRVALSVPEDLRAVLQGFADASGKPLASVIVDLLREMEPQLVALTKIQQQVKAGKVSAAKQTLRHLMGDAMAAAIAGGRPELFRGKKGRG